MTTTLAIPFLDLVSPHRQLEEELVAAFRQALHTATFVGGSSVRDFEEAFAHFCGTQHCVGVGSGTDALRFALMGVGVRSGDVVITVPNTFIATTEAISHAGALPEFVDVDERTYNMDVQKLHEYLEIRCTRDSDGRVISRRSGRPVTAVVPVHLYGQPADMDPIIELAKQYRLTVVEDACQAHGAGYFSGKSNTCRNAGSIARAAAFSFYPGKNLGACGEAGAITTNDEQLAKTCRQLRDHGQAQKYYHDIEGYNGRLDALQAAVLGVKLPYLTEWNARRREAAAQYNRLFTDYDVNVVTPAEPPWSKGVYHLYVIRCSERNGLRDFLDRNGIGTGIHYPIPLHLQKAYTTLRYKTGDFPVCELLSETILSLPMFPTLTADQQRRVVQAVQTFVQYRPVVAAAAVSA
jgi:dTDP-4-amino-4,6-dideoxygalactose transaminase